jgi:MoaA/NifB/PqqE/SkfB family radical SAM enzyme
LASLNQKIGLFKGLLNGEVAKTGPFYVSVELTTRCNLRCLGCPYHSEYRDTARKVRNEAESLPLDVFKRLCHELKAMNTSRMVLQGEGETLLHPDIYEIISVAKESGLHLVLLTNGTLVDRKMARALIDAGLDVLKTSLWASSAEEYTKNYLGSNPGNFERVLHGLSLLERNKSIMKSRVPESILYYIINRNNFETIDAVVDIALETGCNKLLFAPMQDSTGTVSAFMPSEKEEELIRYSLSRVRKRLDSLSIGHDIDWTLLRYKHKKPLWQICPCYIMWFHARIKPDGAVKPCGRCDADFGNIQEKTFTEIWNGPSIRAFRRYALEQRDLNALRENCSCEMCCFVYDMFQVHRYFKWFAPFARWTKK